MKNTLTRKGKTVYAPYLPYAAYKALVQLAKDHNAEIGENADHTLRLKFDEVETAKNVVAKWTADYNANRKVEVAPAPKSAPTQKPKASKVWDAKYFVELAVANGDTYEDAIAEACRITAELRNAQKTPSSKPTAAKGTTSSTKKNADTRSAEDFVADLVKSDKKLAQMAHIDADDKARKPRNAKGVTFDFGKIKGKTNSDKNRALHAQLVSMGMKDSRTHEYQAVWNARPWAN